MLSKRPYLIRALYDWIVDSGLTPHLLVNAEAAAVVVPSQYVHEGRIVLNINPAAVQSLALGNDRITFSARFSGVVHNVSVPPAAVLAIYARENGQGMAFGAELDGEEEPTPPPPQAPKLRKKPALKVVK